MRLNSKNRQPRSRKPFACLCLAGGLMFLGMVFGLSRYSDMQSCEHRMNELISFVKEQSSAYVQYNETAVAKALVRGTTAMQELDSLTLDCGEDALRQYTERLWLTGVSVVDAKGRLVCEYSTDGIGYARLQTDLEPERVLAVVGHPQSTYVRRVQLTDGSFADAAVHSLADGSGAVLAWRHTKAAFAQKSVLSVQDLLDGYDAETTGVVILSDGNRVTASDEPTLIGTDTTANELLRRIRSSGEAETLVYAGRKGLTRYYGMYSHGRDFYYYMYVPGRLLYTNTPVNMIAAFLACVVVLTLLLFVRRGTEKSFLQQQKTLEKAYQTSLEQKNAELERAIRQETAANRAKREFLFNMSHDIRTPLNAVVGYASLISAHGGEAERVRAYSDKVLAASEQLLDVVNETLEISRMEAGHVQLAEAECSLSELVLQARMDMVDLADRADVTLACDIEPLAHDRVLVDAVRLSHVLTQLVDNAIKEIMDITLAAFQADDTVLAEQVEPLEETIDLMIDTLRERHILRLKNGVCAIESGIIFLEILTNLERISDHCSNIAARIVGKESEDDHFDAHEFRRNMHDGYVPNFNEMLAQYKLKYYTPLLESQETA